MELLAVFESSSRRLLPAKYAVFRLAATSLPPEKSNPVKAVLFEKPPVIDGKLDEEVWQQAAVLKNGGEALAFRTGQTFESFSNRGADAWIVRFHFRLTVVLRTSQVGGRFGFLVSYLRISSSKTTFASSG